METKRIAWLDAAKGLGMFLIVLGHVKTVPYNIKTEVYSFHVPLFFFLSGFLFSMEKYPRFFGFFKKKFLTLIVPMAAFSLVNVIVRGISALQLEGKNVFTVRVFARILLSNRHVAGDPVGDLWFVSCLFVTEMLFYGIFRLCRGNWVAIVGLLFVCLLAGYRFVSLLVFLPWNADAALIAVVFYGAGYLTKRGAAVKDPGVAGRAVLFVIFLLIGALAAHHNCVVSRYCVDLWANFTGDIYLFYLAAFAGIFMMLLFAGLLSAIAPAQKMACYVGRNSLIILAFHQSLLFPAVNGLFRLFHLKAPVQFVGSLVLSLAAVILTLLLSVPLNYVINRWLPFLLGRRFAAGQVGGRNA